jgi:hypothetical protein
VQSYFVLSQPNMLAQVVYGLAPWILAYLLEKRYGQQHLGATPRAQQWPKEEPAIERPTVAAELVAAP